MSTTPEIVEQITEEFIAWKEEILRLLGADNVQPETITGNIGGFTYAQIVAIIDQELLAHINNRNAHGLTLAGLGGMAKGTFDTLMKSYYPKAGMPFTSVKGVPWSVAGAVLKVVDVPFMWMGRVMTATGGTFTATASRQYIKFVISTAASGFKQVTVLMSPDASEDINTIIVGHVQLVGGVAQAVFTDVVRIGGAAISQVRRGNAIPATLGTPTQPQTLPASWFS
jgi:hypothetical protein